MREQEYHGPDSPDALEQIFQGPLHWMNLLMIAVNIVIFLGMEFLGNTQDVSYMIKCGAAYAPLILEGEWYRLITSMFLHFDLSHLLNNMVILLFVGDMVEEYVGKWKYFIIYIGGGLLGNLLSLYMDGKTGDMVVSAGASGAVFAVIGAIGIILLKNRGKIRYMTAKKVFFVFGLSLYHGFRSVGVDNAAHVGGVLGGMLLMMLLYRKSVFTDDLQKEGEV